MHSKVPEGERNLLSSAQAFVEGLGEFLHIALAADAGVDRVAQDQEIRAAQDAVVETQRSPAEIPKARFDLDELKGEGDRMIPPRYSHLLAGLLPNARVTIYPDAAHGFLFQHHRQFAADVDAFLAEAD